MRRTLHLSVLMAAVALVGIGLLWSPLAASAQAPCSGTTHVVRTGENLFRISIQYNVSMNQLAAANGITNPDYIQVAQTLCIPSGTSTGGPIGQAPIGGESGTVSGRVMVGPSTGFFVDRAANSPVYTVASGTVDSNSGFSTTATVTLDPVNNLLGLSGGGMIPNAQVRVYVSSALGDISGGIIGMLDADANGSFNGFVEIPFISGATRQYVMIRAYDGRMTFGYFDMARRFPNFSQQ